jgi:hypothetical protein
MIYLETMGLSSPGVGPRHGGNRVFIAFANKV